MNANEYKRSLRPIIDASITLGFEIGRTMLSLEILGAISNGNPQQPCEFSENQNQPQADSDNLDGTVPRDTMGESEVDGEPAPPFRFYQLPGESEYEFVRRVDLHHGQIPQTPEEWCGIGPTDEQEPDGDDGCDEAVEFFRQVGERERALLGYGQEPDGDDRTGESSSGAQA